jgi:hypothetical protein
VAAETVPVSLMLPPDLHPSILRSGDDTARVALTEIYTTTVKIKDTSRAIAEQNRPPLKHRRMTPEDKLEQAAWGKEQRGQQRELLRKSVPLIERAGAQADKALQAMAERVRAADDEVRKALVPRTPDSPMNSEIRAAVAARKHEAITVVIEAINAGQREVVAAVLGAPAMLTGLTPEQHATLAMLARKGLEPELQKKLEALQRDTRVLQRAREWFLGQMTEFAAKWTDPNASLIDKGLGLKS